MNFGTVADIPNVVAIKCACFDRYRTQNLVKGVMESHRADEVALYTGNDDHIVMDLLTPLCPWREEKAFCRRSAGSVVCLD